MLRSQQAQPLRYTWRRLETLYCKERKGLNLYAYVFMLNHMHLVVSSPDTIGFVRDFKRHTTKELLSNIVATEPEVMKLFETDGGGREFWARTNMPKAVEHERFLLQKVEYIHNNPVRKGYVRRPEYWIWSSAIRTARCALTRCQYEV